MPAREVSMHKIVGLRLVRGWVENLFAKSKIPITIAQNSSEDYFWQEFF